MVLVDSKAQHFQEAARRDFSYTHKIIDRQNNIHEMPRQYLNIERSIIGWGQVDGQILVKLSNLHPSESLTVTDIMIYRLFSCAEDTNAGYRSNALDEKTHVEYIPSNGDKSPNRMTLKDIEIKSFTDGIVSTLL